MHHAAHDLVEGAVTAGAENIIIQAGIRSGGGAQNRIKARLCGVHRHLIPSLCHHIQNGAELMGKRGFSCLQIADIVNSFHA